MKNSDVRKVLEESLIGDSILRYMVKNNIPYYLRNNVNFIKLLIDKLYIENDISNLEMDLEKVLFIDYYPDGIYSETFERKIEEIKNKLTISIWDLKEIDNKLNNILGN
ncbi:hypothetical protein [Clostridium botulinum]|uniref:hypothetical protein n=1 Tax=Clostridium botulinum TaxID=1491 RepID=UPI0007738083|nr:hypothetical protein [Clostridium botulinum]